MDWPGADVAGPSCVRSYALEGTLTSTVELNNVATFGMIDAMLASQLYFALHNHSKKGSRQTDP